MTIQTLATEAHSRRRKKMENDAWLTSALDDLPSCRHGFFNIPRGI